MSLLQSLVPADLLQVSMEVPDGHETPGSRQPEWWQLAWLAKAEASQLKKHRQDHQAAGGSFIH